eukprot:6205019-Pleurochrysis_carterae.AAC.1
MSIDVNAMTSVENTHSKLPSKQKIGQGPKGGAPHREVVRKEKVKHKRREMIKGRTKKSSIDCNHGDQITRITTKEKCDGEKTMDSMSGRVMEKTQRREKQSKGKDKDPKRDCDLKNLTERNKMKREKEKRKKGREKQNMGRKRGQEKEKSECRKLREKTENEKK